MNIIIAMLDVGFLASYFYIRIVYQLVSFKNFLVVYRFLLYWLSALITISISSMSSITFFYF